MITLKYSDLKVKWINCLSTFVGSISTLILNRALNKERSSFIMMRETFDKATSSLI